MNIDLHCHSTVSDGQLAPEQLIRHAAEAGISHLALTDHDSIDGLPAAAQAASQAGLHLISGVEMSCDWDGRSLHVVGLNFDPDNPALRRHLHSVQQQRRERAAQISHKLAQAGLPDALAGARVVAGHDQITRTHFAAWLVQAGHCKDTKQAFKRYLAAGKPGAVKSQWPSMTDSLACIAQAGGVTVLAHPLRYNMTAAWRQRMLAAFAAAGGHALEVSAGASQKPDDIHQCAQLAREHGLLASQGSDFHSLEQRWIPYGRLAPLPSDLIPVWQHFV